MAESSSVNSSTNNSQSTSSSQPVQTQENQIIDQISAYASGLASQMLGWANQTYAQTSNITNQAVGNFFNTSKQMSGLSDTLTGQYNNLFAPENAQLVAEANSYASPARMAVDMGQAGATQAQAGDQAIKNSEQQLQSYGIDPSSGRYAALDKAAAVQNAANVAGAENTQRNADIATGQKLRSEAVQVGSTLPAAIANVNNTATQANTGAVNASLSNANTGKNLMSLSNDYLKTAMDVKLPATASQSQSTGTGSSMGSSSSGGGNSGGGGSGGGGSSGGGGGGSSGGGGGGDGWSDPNNYTQQTTYGGRDAGLGALDAPTAGGISNYQNSANPGASQNVPADFYGSGSGSTDGSGGGDFSMGYAGGGAIDDTDDASGAVPGSMSPSGGQQVDDVQAQGPHGQHLNLNAHEFVIPQDVALWKGQEFFQKMIDQSRKMRMMAPAKPQPTQAMR